MNKKVLVSLKNINKIFEDGMHVVKDLNLDIYEGEFLTLLGSSGCGKTTTLRMIGGFNIPTSGSILIDGKEVIGKEPFERNINTVFQSYALFPHMTIYNNIAFGLKMKKLGKAEIQTKVQEALELVQLSGFENRYPHELSGGQRQRIAIARALVNSPEVLLLDEPLGALDLKLRKQMQVELKRMQRRLGITFIYVTHDQEEALTMSDRIVIMNEGTIEQIGTPDEIYETPKSRFVATFIGETNLFEASVMDISEDNTMALNTETGAIKAKNTDFVKDEYLYISVRPEKMKLSTKPVENFNISAVVKENIYVGSFIKTILTLPNNQEIKVQRLSGEKLPKIDEVLYLYWEQKDAVFMHTRGDKLLDMVEYSPLGGE